MLDTYHFPAVFLMLMILTLGPAELKMDTLVLLPLGTCTQFSFS